MKNPCFVLWGKVRKMNKDLYTFRMVFSIDDEFKYNNTLLLEKLRSREYAERYFQNKNVKFDTWYGLGEMEILSHTFNSLTISTKYPKTINPQKNFSDIAKYIMRSIGKRVVKKCEGFVKDNQGNNVCQVVIRNKKNKLHAPDNR